MAERLDRGGARAARGTVVVATPSGHATDAALAVLAQGGSAADALVAVLAMLTLTEPSASGLGGGAVIVWHDARSGQAGVVDGLASAPARITARLEEDFDGRTIPAERVAVGGRAVGVPGGLRAVELFHRRFGRRAWAEAIAPALALAEAGVPMPHNLARVLGEFPGVRRDALARACWFGAAGRPLPPGTPWRNLELAATLRLVAEGGADALYLGETAERMVAAVGADLMPGTLTLADLAACRAVERAPLRVAIPGAVLLAAPPPCFGGMVAAQVVGMMQAHGLAGLDPVADAHSVHVLCEAGRLAYSDRSVFVGDPAFADDASAALLEPGYVQARARLIGARTADAVAPGAPEGVAAGAAGGGLGGVLTSHSVVVDGQGLVASMTSTINQVFGAQLSAGGMFLNNVMTNFARVPRAHGRDARNRAEPGKRAMTSFAPVLLLDGAGAAQAALGCAGGNRIPGMVANAVLRWLAGRRDAAAVLAAPQALRTGAVTDLEPELAEFAPALAARGHWPMVRSFDASAQAAFRDGPTWHAGADPRRGGTAGALA